MALDVVAAVVPFVPAVGAVRHATKLKGLVGFAGKATDAAKVAKKVANPHGRVGGKAHRAGVEKARARAQSEFPGQRVRKEGKIDTPGGKKSARYGDVVVYKNGKPHKVYQVGDVLKDGIKAD